MNSEISKFIDEMWNDLIMKNCRRIVNNEVWYKANDNIYKELLGEIGNTRRDIGEQSES